MYTQIQMGGCQNYGPFLGTLNIRGRNIIGTPRRTIILTTTQILSKAQENGVMQDFGLPPRSPKSLGSYFLNWLLG